MLKCKKCGEEKHETQFYFRNDSGHYRSECKACVCGRMNQLFEERVKQDPEAYERLLASRRNGRKVGHPLRDPGLEPGDWGEEFKAWRMSKRSDAVDAIDLPERWQAWLRPENYSFYAMVLLLNREVFWKFQFKWRRSKDPEILAKARARNHLPEIAKFRREYYQARRKDPVWAAEQNRKTTELFKANKERYYAQRREYRARDPERHRRWNAGWHREKRRTDPQYRIGNRLRSRLWHALAKQGVKKAFKTEDLVGCSVAELRVHLEKQFKDGMSWGNMGEWHIDHIKPCARFDLTDVVQQQACFHWTNLQPLWGSENISKSDNYLADMASGNV